MSDNGYSDSFTEVTSQSWLQRLFGSFVAALIGLVMIVGSVVLLSWNEGRAVGEMTSLDAGARSVVSIPVEIVDPAHEGQLVHVTGLTKIGSAASDPVFHITPADAVRLRRHVETYQWQEHEQTETEKHLGGSETKRTTYTYSKAWVDRPIDSARFKVPNGHGNPAPSLRTTVFDARNIQLGAFALDDSVVDKLASFKALSPPGSASGTESASAFHRVGDQFYRGNSPQAPEVGDMQVSYEMVEAQTISVVGAQIGRTLTQFRGKDGRVVEIVDRGTRSAADMFQEAKADSAMLTWILRGVGFLVMFIGLALTAAPLSWFVSLIPVLSDLLGMAAVFIALMLAVPLTLITIAVAWMAYRPLVGGGLIVAGVVAAILLRKVLPQRRHPIAAPFAPPAMR